MTDNFRCPGGGASRAAMPVRVARAIAFAREAETVSREGNAAKQCLGILLLIPSEAKLLQAAPAPAGVPITSALEPRGGRSRDGEKIFSRRACGGQERFVAAPGRSDSI
jgi:hypothetical protein